jgi:two-component system, response regulator RegA
MMTASSQSLLLVDDDVIFCKVLAAALRKHGFDVCVAHDVAEALQLACKQVPAYAVIDLRMPGESGLSLIGRLKSLSGDVKILVLTGYASIATAVEAIKLGAMHYLAKPADADEIAAALVRETGDSGATIESKPLSVDRLEWEHLQKVLLDCQGNISAAARSLGMHRRTLQRKLAKRPVRR